MGQQFKYFRQDVNRMLGKSKTRILYIWLNSTFWGIFLYRTERSLFLLFGRPYQILRIIFLPIINLIHSLSNLDVNYKADIKGGLLILHAAVGVVISGDAVIGKNLTLTGGNVIGGKAGSGSGDIQIGYNCEMGANAVIIGPIKLGNNITIGASGCAIKDCLEDNAILVGVPAKKLPSPKA